MSSYSSSLAARASRLAPSPTLAVDARAKALKAEGHDICGFGTGEPDFDTPAFIKEAAIVALHEGRTKYCPSAGLPELRERLAEKAVRLNGIEGAESANVVVSPGGKYSCYLAMQALCDPGDEVIIPAPYWVSYPEMARLAEARPVFVETTEEDGFRLDPERLRAALSKRSRLLVLNSPSNPTGAVLPPECIREIVEVCLGHGVFILSDEIYEHLLYDGARHLSPASLSSEAFERVITVSGFSKTFSMTGWRLGTMIAPRTIASAVANIQSQTTSNATTFAQYGAVAALRDWERAKEAIDVMLAVFERRRRRMLEGLRAIEGITCTTAQGAFYLFPNVGAFGMDVDTFAERLLEDQLVAVVPGSGFGSDNCIRLSYATADDLIERGLQRLGEFCRSL